MSRYILQLHEYPPAILMLAYYGACVRTGRVQPLPAKTGAPLREAAYRPPYRMCICRTCGEAYMVNRDPVNNRGREPLTVRGRCKNCIAYHSLKKYRKTLNG